MIVHFQGTVGEQRLDFCKRAFPRGVRRGGETRCLPQHDIVRLGRTASDELGRQARWNSVPATHFDQATLATSKEVARDLAAFDSVDFREEEHLKAVELRM